MERLGKMMDLLLFKGRKPGDGKGIVGLLRDIKRKPVEKLIKLN